MPRGWTGGAADRGDHVEPTAMAMDLGAFGRKALDIPFRRIMRGVIYMLDLPGGRQAIIGQPDAIAARQEQPARPVLADSVARIDMVRHLEIDRVAPRSVDRVGPAHPDRIWAALGRNVEKITPVILVERD